MKSIKLVWYAQEKVDTECFNTYFYAYFKEVEFVKMCLRGLKEDNGNWMLDMLMQDDEYGYSIMIGHKDLNLVKYLQSKFASACISGEKKIDAVHQLAKWLSLAEIQGLFVRGRAHWRDTLKKEVKTVPDVLNFTEPKYLDEFSPPYCDLSPLIALVAMREEPSKAKWLQMPKLGNEQQKPNQSKRYHGGKK